MTHTSPLMLLARPVATYGPRQCCAGRCTSAAPTIDSMPIAMRHVQLAAEGHRADGARSYAIDNFVAHAHR